MKNKQKEKDGGPLKRRNKGGLRKARQDKGGLLKIKNKGGLREEGQGRRGHEDKITLKKRRAEERRAVSKGK